MRDFSPESTALPSAFCGPTTSKSTHLKSKSVAAPYMLMQAILREHASSHEGTSPFSNPMLPSSQTRGVVAPCSLPTAIFLPATRTSPSRRLTSAPECATSANNSPQLRCERRQARCNTRVTYDTSCHLLYGQRGGETSERMLRAVAGDNFVALNGTERCCGAAGVYNLLQPEMSQRVLREKLDHVEQTHAAILATGNPGCQMHIGAGASLARMDLRVCHPIELVDQAYGHAGFYEDLKDGE